MNKAEAALNQKNMALAYRRLFLSEDGTIKMDADAVLRDLERVCMWMPKGLPTASGGNIDPYAVVADAARRSVFAHIKRQLFIDLAKFTNAIEGDRK